MPSTKKYAVCGADRRQRCKCAVGTADSLNEFFVDARLQTKKPKAAEQVAPSGDAVSNADLPAEKGAKRSLESEEPDPSKLRREAEVKASEEEVGRKHENEDASQAPPEQSQGGEPRAAVEKASESAQSHYDVLAVAPTATAAEIRAAYNRLVTKVHPDKAGSPFLFRLVQQAWGILGDPEQRKAYDMMTGRSQKLPSGWAIRASRTTGKLYFVRCVDQHVQWADPDAHGFVRDINCFCAKCKS